MQMVILAGGLGSRLKGTVKNTPKPMALINNRPFLEYQIKWAKEAGSRDIVLCVGYLAEKIIGHFGDGGKFGVRIRYSQEKTLLGTAGALKKAENLLEERFVVINGDTFRNISVKELYEFHQNRGSVMTFSVAGVNDMADYGGILLDEGNRVINFVEKGIAGPGWINGGTYVIEKKVLDLIPRDRVCSLEKEIIPLLLSQKEPIYGLPQQGLFIDIGTPENYKKAQEVLMPYDY